MSEQSRGARIWEVVKGAAENIGVALKAMWAAIPPRGQDVVIGYVAGCITMAIVVLLW